tara:strand:+ start:58 stop:1137 length:1080 start_codon:yes stop_codon:yes gene_type:complete
MALLPETKKALMDALRVKQPQSIAAPIQPRIDSNPIAESYYNYIQGDPLAQQVSGGDPLKKLLRFASEFVPGINTELAQRRGDKVGEALSYLDALGAAGAPIKAGAKVATRLQRARDMGFDTDKVYYHGSGANISEFKLPSRQTGQIKTADTGVFFSSSPTTASTYTKKATEGSSASIYPVNLNKDEYLKITPIEKGMRYNELNSDKLIVQFPDGRSASATEVFNTPKNTILDTDDLGRLVRQSKHKGLIIEDIVDPGVSTSGRFIPALKYLKERGYDVNLPSKTLKDHNDLNKVPDSVMNDAWEYARKEMDAPSDVVIVFDPKTIRSVNAQFDPSKVNSGNILAGVGGLLALDPIRTE